MELEDLRTTPTPQQQPQQQPQQPQPSQPQPPSQQPSPQPQPPPQPSPLQPPVKSPSPPAEPTEQKQQPAAEDDAQQQQASQPTSPPKPPPVQRAVSMPASPPERYRPLPPVERRLEYSQSERPPSRPKLARSMSKKEAIKNFIKKETATFFGVGEDNQEDEQLRWLDRRKRLASRKYGPLKAEYRIPSSGRSHRRVVSELAGQPAMGRMSAWRPDVLPGGPGDVPDASQDNRRTASVRRKDSVARMTWDGLSYVVTTLTRHRPRPRSQATQWSRSFSPGSVASQTSIEDDVFFDQPAATRPSPSAADARDGGQLDTALEPLEPPIRYTAVPGWRRDPHRASRTRDHQREVGGTRIFSSLLDSVLDNSDRRQYGMGWVGRMFGRSLRKSVAQDEDVKQQLNDLEDHRPMFTYWVTTVQVLILIISLICYGFGPFGVDLQARSSQVLVPSLSLQQVDYLEPANFWFGPRAADLIHLGAKFAPCMRVDDKIQQQVEKTRSKERETACCIRNDDSGCVQSSRADCSNTISTWKKWTPRDQGPGGRISGSVCGLDPKYCDAPASVHPYEWPDDITKWPICRKTNMQFSVQKHQGPRDKSAEHMICEVIGHPCCIGIHGMCKITTREYCDFVRGHFHEEASLCSQVSCLDDVCGMVPFYFAEVPDQFYRLWTSLFLHAGILQLCVTLVIQVFLMRDLEKLTGSLRIAIIYLGSGMAGNLASAIFVPYRADTGFPFDDSDFGEGDRDRSFRSHIDDIVKRHPELAEHLSFDRDFDRFPFRSNTWGHKRRGSAGKEDFPGGSAEERRFSRPFASRFDERFGFPFNRSSFDREPEFCPQEEPPAQDADEEKEEKREEKSSEKPPQVPSDRRRKLNPNVPQSNTVDLGQKQEPVHETRGQRSMSAPPENRSQQRYVSSINIPIQNDNVQQSAPPPQPQSQQSKSNERVIPIHVEGRDEPVVPKHSQPFSTTPPQPERAYAPPPQAERAFSGARPGFGGHWDRREFFPSEQGFYPEQQYYEGGGPFFKNREPPQHRTDFGGAYKPQQQQQQQFQRPQQYAHQQQAPPQHQQPPPQAPQQHTQQQQQQQPPTAPPPPPPQAPQQPAVPKGPIELIQFVQKDVLALMNEVEKFNGKPKDKQYLYLDEMLTRNLLKLDNIDTEGKENIRQARKEAIRCIQKCISILEAKAAANEQLRSQLMGVDAKSDESEPITSLEVSGVARSGSQASAQQEEKAGETSMDTTAPAEAQGSAVEDVEMKPEVLPVEEPRAGVLDTKEEQPKEEKTEGEAEKEATPEPSQPEVKEESKDKKEKKKVKKKEKPAEQAEK